MRGRTVGARGSARSASRTTTTERATQGELVVDGINWQSIDGRGAYVPRGGPPGSPLTVGVPICLEEGPLAATQPIEKFFSNPMFGVQTVSSLRETHQLTEFEWIRVDLKGFAGQTGRPV